VARGQWIGPTLIGVGWAVSSLGYYHAMQALWHGGAVLIVVGCALTALGADVLKRFFPAFLVLAFLIPAPGRLRLRIAQPLQEVLAGMTRGAFEIAGVHIEQFGNVLTINNQPVQVAEACNGLRMVFTLVLVAYAVAFGTPLKGYTRALLILGSIPAALMCNFIRMVPTVWLFGHASREMAESFHNVVAFGLLLGIVQILRWAMVPVARYTLAYD
jgi:exosortase